MSRLPTSGTLQIIPATSPTSSTVTPSEASSPEEPEGSLNLQSESPTPVGTSIAQSSVVMGEAVTVLLPVSIQVQVPVLIDGAGLQWLGGWWFG